MVGASAPFLLWWFSQIFERRRFKQEKFNYLEKILVDQINNILELRGTINNFLNINLINLKRNIEGNRPEQYSIDHTFLPLFSVRSLNNNIHEINIGSSYVENKLARCYSISQDIPHIIEDVRRQFSYLLETNKELSIAKLNDAKSQKRLYLQNIDGFSQMVTEDILKNNIPKYLKAIIEARVSINKFKELGLRRWCLKFDPRYQFFLNKSKYQKAQKVNFEKIEQFFQNEVEEEFIKLS